MPPPPPVRSGIPRADNPREDPGKLLNMMRMSDLGSLSALEGSKHIPFRKEPVSNNTSITAAAREQRRRVAEASAAEQKTESSESKNTLTKKEHESNNTLISSDQKGKRKAPQEEQEEAPAYKRKAGGLASKNTLYTRDIQCMRL